ncbi:MAG: hemolysin III family protein [Acidobacteriota bacterium]
MKSTPSPTYSFGEELANSITHGLGWLLSAGGLGLIVTLAAINRHAVEVVAVSVFGATLIVLYGASTLYHALPGQQAKRVLRVLDHTAIYLLIAGTYTPIALAVLGGTKGWVLFGAIWGLAALGVVVTVVGFRGAKWLEMALYVTMGWLVVTFGKTLITTMDPVPLWLLFSGGLAYTSGIVFYVWKRMPYSHMVWHLFVLAGSVLHFLAILFAVTVG